MSKNVNGNAVRFPLINMEILRKNKHVFFLSMAFVMGLVLATLDLTMSDEFKNGFWGGVLVEAHGMFLDIILFGILLTVYEQFTEKHNDIARLKEEIDDYRGWRESEATYRIAGCSKRLLKKGYTGLDLSYCYLRGARLMSLDLHGSSFESADLQNIYLREANLKEANFHCADLSQGHLPGAILNNANLTRTKLNSADLSSCNLEEADLRIADLLNTDLSRANLRKANFKNTFLRFTNLRQADLRGSNIHEARLDNVSLDYAKVDKKHLSVLPVNVKVKLVEDFEGDYYEIQELES